MHLYLISKISAFIRYFSNIFNNVYDKATFKQRDSLDLIAFNLNDSEYKVELRRGDSDFWVFKQIITDAEYNFVIRYLNQNNITPNIILDCGANIGLTSIYFKHHYPQSTIYAFEIDSDNIKLMKKNFSLNHLSNIKIIHKGIWDESTKLKISNNFRDHYSWSLTLDDGSIPIYEKTETLINTIKLSQFIEDYKIDVIDLIKMDIEGAEGKIFKNNCELNSILKRIKALAIETHEECIRKQAVIDIMTENKFINYESGQTILFINQSFLKT